MTSKVRQARKWHKLDIKRHFKTMTLEARIEAFFRRVFV